MAAGGHDLRWSTPSIIFCAQASASHSLTLSSLDLAAEVGIGGHVLGSWSGKKQYARHSMLSRGGAPAGAFGSLKAVWNPPLAGCSGSLSHCLKSSWRKQQRRLSDERQCK